MAELVATDVIYGDRDVVISHLRNVAINRAPCHWVPAKELIFDDSYFICRQWDLGYWTCLNEIGWSKLKLVGDLSLADISWLTSHASCLDKLLLKSGQARLKDDVLSDDVAIWAYDA